MRVAVFEDDDAKWHCISGVLIAKGVKINSICRLDHVSQFIQIVGKPFDLCIIDIKMPSLRGGAARSAGSEILQMLEYSGMQKVPVLAITAFISEIADSIHLFSAKGCIVYEYHNQSLWSQALDIYLAQAREKGRYDFLIFTAIQKERSAYLSVPGIEIRSEQRNGLNLWELDYAGSSGAIVLLPRMGLVNASVTVARALEMYNPSIVAMTGICAGVGSNAEMGQLLVTDLVWEYQSGKWFSDTLQAEPYQTGISKKVRDELEIVLEDSGLLRSLESYYNGQTRPSIISQPKLSIMTSGSAVIASADKLDSVKEQHRKVSGLDMEIFGFHRAVELSGLDVFAFSAKTVVDKADEVKGDSLHEYGCVVSAGFALRTIKRSLDKLNSVKN